jgi:hypothetical protein
MLTNVLHPFEFLATNLGGSFIYYVSTDRREGVRKKQFLCFQYRNYANVEGLGWSKSLKMCLGNI